MKPLHASSPPCDLRVGTSGYSYTEWTDAGFYPAGTADELRAWVEARQGLIFFNNHVRAQAPKNAKVLLQLLNDAGLPAG